MEQREILGKFNGEAMVGEDNRIYPVSGNYASKSKLIDGDKLKLTITPEGAFLYKQVEPVARKRLAGEIILHNKELAVFAEPNIYRILRSSVTYFKAQVGDDATIIVPEEGIPTWAALENIVSKSTDKDKEL